MNNRAVILGSGIAGLLAARVLSDYFSDVVLIERDAKPDTVGPRKGVPQGHHIHVLLNRGEDILEDLFPGFRDVLREKDAVEATLGKDVRWYLAGRWMPTFEDGMVSFFQSRPLLEDIIRSFVSKISTVHIRYGTTFEDFVLNDEKDAVRSITVREKGSKESVDLEGSFFLDATGRGSRLLSQLTLLGYSEPAESRVGVDFAYSSGIFTLQEADQRDWRAVLIYPKAPEETRAAAIVPIEDNQWLVTAAGYNGDHPPLDPEGFLQFIASLSQPQIYEALKTASAVSPLKPFKFKAGIRRHFERSDCLPNNLLVIGDAICSANPFFGQGIAVAAQEAKVLQDLCQTEGTEALCQDKSVRRDYFERVAGILDISWGLAIGEDLKYPSTTGKKPFGYALSRWFKDRIMSSNDPDVARQFYRVMHFAEPPSSLASAKVLKSILLAKR
ncbi:MAG: hypothetical protein ABJN40_21380 [Sneathiella sp.]